MLGGAMTRTALAAASLVFYTLAFCSGALAAPALRYQVPAAYPETEAAAVWRSLGASYVRKALKENQVDRDPVLNARVDAVMAAIGRAAARLYPAHAVSSWRVLLIAEFGHGAVAFPGGTVLMDASFVRQLQLTDDELALLLAHEVAHLVAEHPSEKLSFVADRMGKEKAPTAGSALLAFFTADTYALQFQPTARLQEREADAIGAAVLDASGYDPARALVLFDKLANLGQDLETSTHDGATARREAVLRALDEARRRSPRPPR
jgi:predicted Zn-dependent protease